MLPNTSFSEKARIAGQRQNRTSRGKGRGGIVALFAFRGMWGSEWWLMQGKKALIESYSTSTLLNNPHISRRKSRHRV